MNNVSYFEIQSSDPAREISFYKNVFGWEFTREPSIPIEYYRISGAGPNGALLKRPAKVPPMECGTNAYCCSIQVASFDETAKKVLDNGGKVAMPKFAVPGMAWHGYFLDADNNVFGTFEVDPNAK